MEERQVGYYQLDLSYKKYLESNKSLVYQVLGQQYVILENLSSGNYGTVYQALNQETKKLVAAKVIDLAQIDKLQRHPNIKEKIRRLSQTESELMGCIDSPYVMKLYDVYENQCLKIMIMEYCDGGTLSSLIKSRQKLAPEEAIEMFKQLVLGVAAMHQKNIIHRDLKTANIMLHKGFCKIVDLGFSKLLPSNSEIFQLTILGTIPTMAPEVVNREKYGVKADIWSLGVIFYEMIYGVMPYEGMKSDAMYKQICQKEIFPDQGKVNGYRPPVEIVELLKKLLTIDQSKRVGWEELITLDILKMRDKLPQVYRVTVDLSHLREQLNPPDVEITDDERIKQLIVTVKEPPKKSSIGLKNLTRSAVLKYKGEIDRSDDKVQQQANKYYLDCLKTQFILKKIIWKIEEGSYLPMQDRIVVEMMFLLVSRCFSNMSFTRHKISNKEHEVIINLKQNVNKMYSIVHQKFDEYDKALYKIESELTSIVGDKLRKIFFTREIKEKDNYLSGIENDQEQLEKNRKHGEQNSGYSRKDQINYTYQHYIQPILSKFDKIPPQVVICLRRYREINSIKISDIKDKSFNEVVNQYLKK